MASEKLPAGGPLRRLLPQRTLVPLSNRSLGGLDAIEVLGILVADAVKVLQGDRLVPIEGFQISQFLLGGVPQWASSVAVHRLERSGKRRL